MQFRVSSFRNGIQILRASGAFDELVGVLTRITLEEVSRLRESSQGRYDARAQERGPRKAGIQNGLNKLLKARLQEAGWTPEVAVFEKDPAARKGMWTMDFVKAFREGIAVGLEVTFNHAEALPWTLIRPTLAHESETALPAARIHVGVVVIGTDHLKGNSSEGFRMDSAVGTYERLRTLLPKMRAVLPAPLVILGLDWKDGGLTGVVEEISMHTSMSGLGFP
jgi:hypothetical protein